MKTCKSIAYVATVLALAPAGLVIAADADCQPLFQAMDKLFTTPSHQYLKQTNTITGEKAVASEIINTGKAMYIMVDGKWHNSNATGEVLKQQEELGRKNAKVTTCRMVHAESVDGVAAKLFTAHTETEFGASDQQLWIADSSGLPVRETIEMSMGDHAGTSRAEIRVEYSGVSAPVVAAAP
jgi:hypothetical protein